MTPGQIGPPEFPGPWRNSTESVSRNPLMSLEQNMLYKLTNMELNTWTPIDEY